MLNGFNLIWFQPILRINHVILSFQAFIDKLENDLRNFYDYDSDGVWVEVYNNGMERMLVHSVSQYLMLTSKSTLLLFYS